MGVEDRSVENLGLLKRSGDLPLHGQCLIPSTARLALDSGPWKTFCTISPTPKRLDPWTRQGRRQLWEGSRGGSELQEPQEGQSRGLGSCIPWDGSFLARLSA